MTKDLNFDIITIKNVYIKRFIIITCTVLYYFLLFAIALDFPFIDLRAFYRFYVHWYGSALCFMGVIWFISAVITLNNNQNNLITTGPFAINRNPMYTGILLILAGVFITFANWIFIVYFIVVLYITHRQIIKEEIILKNIYGEKYLAYCKRVRRYF